MPTNDIELHTVLGAITIMGSGRLGPTLSALIGATGTALGGLALSRSRRRVRSGIHDGASGGRGGPVAALALGTTSVGLGVLFLATADGGPGTGNGVIASVAAVVLGPIAVVLGGLSHPLRYRSTSTPLPR